MSSTLVEQINQLKQTIADIESQRSILGDEAVEASLIPIRRKLGDLQAQVESQSEKQVDVPQRKRKLVTLLYMDVVGSTAMTQDLDPEDTMEILEKAILSLVTPIEAHGGHVTRYTGDGFKAIFGEPIAREDDPEQAIRAGLKILEVSKSIAEEIEREWSIEDFQVRIGIDTGLAALGGQTEAEDTVKGRVVNLAVRIESAAPPGGLLISHNTFRHVRGVFNVDPLEPIKAKGFLKPVPVYLVRELKPRAFRVQTRGVEGVETQMVGRRTELDTLKDAFLTAFEEGEGQVVTISGEAGVGKSRLLYEFQNWIELQPPSYAVRFFQGRGRQEVQGSPYSLLRDVFAFRFHILDDDSGEQTCQKIESGFCDVFGQDEAGIMRAHILGQLLGFEFSANPKLKSVLDDAEQLRNRGLMYLNQYFKTMSQEMPVIIFLEDIHWGDDSSLDVFRSLGDQTPQIPLLIIGAARLSLFERRPYWGEGQTYHVLLELRPLSKRESRQLVAEILKFAADIPTELRELVVQGAEGNPFYTEELIKMLIEDRVIIPDEENWQVDLTRLEEINVPSTLSGVLQARLDSLPFQERTVLQQAAVVGRLFWDRIVSYIQVEGGNGGGPEIVPLALTSLRNRELVYRHEESTFIGATEYIFKHDVLRDVTYESVPMRQRKTYHRLVADWLIKNSQDRIGEYYGMIADHLEEAGKRKEAMSYLKNAGVRATKSYANQEAVNYFSRALELVPESELMTRFDLLLARVDILDLQGNREAQRQDLETLNILTTELESKEKQLEVGLRWTRFLYSIRDYQSAVEKAEQVLKHAKETESILFIAKGHLSLGRTLMWMRKKDIAEAHLNQALTGFQTVGNRREIGDTLRTLGFFASTQYDLQTWHEYSQQALAFARQIGDKPSEAEAINHLGHVACYIGDYSTAKIYFRHYLILARETGNRFQKGLSFQNLGWVENDLKDFTRALDYYEHALKTTQAIKDIEGEGDSLIGLGDALAGLEKWDAAIKSYSEAIRVFDKFDADWGVAGSRSGLARVALAQGNETGALELVDGILDFLSRDEGLFEGIRESYLTCFKVLEATHDPRANVVLEKGYTKIRAIADKIQDRKMRQSFLENVPYNCELMRLWEEQQEQRL